MKFNSFKKLNQKIPVPPPSENSKKNSVKVYSGKVKAKNDAEYVMGPGYAKHLSEKEKRTMKSYKETPDFIILNREKAKKSNDLRQIIWDYLLSKSGGAVEKIYEDRMIELFTEKYKNKAKTNQIQKIFNERFHKFFAEKKHNYTAKDSVQLLRKITREVDVNIDKIFQDKKERKSTEAAKKAIEEVNNKINPASRAKTKIAA